MAPQIMSMDELVRRVHAQVVSDDQVREWYGESTLGQVYDRLEEVYHGYKAL